jgi:hypothetical protein
MAVAASYDQSMQYGAQTPFSDQLAVQWEGGMWQYDPQHDSIITAGNGSSKPTQVAFTIFYNQGTQKYELDQTLQPGDQIWMDIGKLIRESIPDKNGNTLPANLPSGSYDVRDLSGTRVGTLFEGKVIYDKTYGHVTYGCAACCGWGIPYLWFNPLSVPIAAQTGDGVWASYPCESEIDDVSANFYNSWTTGNTSIVTVDSLGTHTGLAVGSTTSKTNGYLASNDAHNNCPLLFRTPSGGVTVPDATPLITGINPSDWNAGSTIPVTFTGQYFGTNAPTLSFSPGSGITYSLSSYSDTQIAASVTVASGTPNEDVNVSVTNNGYGGSSFNGGMIGNSGTSAPVYATVHSPINSPEITVIAWVNGQAPDLNPIPYAGNMNLVTHLNSTPSTCGSEVFLWSVVQTPVDIQNSTDQNYANSWLVKYSANPAPPTTITPSAQLSAGNFRLINDFGSGGGFYQIGTTPDPCGTNVPTTILHWLGAGQASQYMGASGTSASGKIYQLAEGRVGSMGQAGSQTINGGRTVPWIWNVIEFDASGNPTYSDVAMFPTYSVYVNGALTATYPQSTVVNFVAKDQTYQRTPSQVQ